MSRKHHSSRNAAKFVPDFTCWSIDMYNHLRLLKIAVCLRTVFATNLIIFILTKLCRNLYSIN